MTHPHPIHLIRPDAPELALRGPHRVGVRTLHLDVAAMTDPRQLPVEVWYPAAPDTPQGTIYHTILRDGVTPERLAGLAARDAAIAPDMQAPLVVLSHGYPGNRFLMSHLAESLAAKGYVVATPDHLGSTYDTQVPFAETLVNRPLDQRGVIDAMTLLDGDLGALCDTDRIAIIGYSMGGYGALVVAGAGLATTALEHDSAPSDDSLARHLMGRQTHTDLFDPRIKAILPIGPWGNGQGMWDVAGLSGVRVPMLLMAGTMDETSSYAAMRAIFEHSTGVDRHLLSFIGAGHNAAAPYPPAPASWAFSEALGRAPFDHYSDPVWDMGRMNNIAQHYAAAFLGLHLKGETEMSRYLDNTDFPGFGPETACGLQLETRKATS